MSTDSETEELTHADPEADVRMTIWEHLDEFRKRVIKAAAGTLIGTIACWTYKEKLLRFLALPYQRIWKEHFPDMKFEMQGLAPADAFSNYLQLAMTGGVVIGAPIIFYQLWAFISPGLYSREKRYIVPFVFFSTGLFLSGVAFAYYVAFPFTFNYFFSLNGRVDGDADMLLITRPTQEHYLDFATRMLLAFGFVFELPLFITFLAIAGIVTPKQLVKFSRWAILGSFILGAIATPGPEVTSQIAVSGALCLLYFVSVGVSFLVAPKRAEPEPSSDE